MIKICHYIENYGTYKFKKDIVEHLLIYLDGDEINIIEDKIMPLTKLNTQSATSLDATTNRKSTSY